MQDSGYKNKNVNPIFYQTRGSFVDPLDDDNQFNPEFSSPISNYQPDFTNDLVSTYRQPKQKPISGIDSIVNATRDRNFNEERMLENARRNRVDIDPVLSGIVKGAFTPIGDAMSSLDKGTSGIGNAIQKFGATGNAEDLGKSGMTTLQGLLHTAFTPFTVPFGAVTGGLRESGEIGNEVATGLEKTMNLPFDLINRGSYTTGEILGTNDKNLVSPKFDKQANDIATEILGLLLLGKTHKGVNKFNELAQPKPNLLKPEFRVKGDETVPLESVKDFSPRPNLTKPTKGVTQEKLPTELMSKIEADLKKTEDLVQKRKSALEKPYFEDVNNVPELANKISKGKKLNRADLQLQKNFPKELETKLQELQNVKEKGSGEKTRRDIIKEQRLKDEQNTKGNVSEETQKDLRYDANQVAIERMTKEGKDVNEISVALNLPKRKVVQTVRNLPTKKLSDNLSAKEILNNEGEVYPTPTAIKEAKEILGDKFISEFEKFKKEIGDKNKAPEGNKLEMFARRTVTAKKLGVNELTGDKFYEAYEKSVKELEVKNEQRPNKEISEQTIEPTKEVTVKGGKEDVGEEVKPELGTSKMEATSNFQKQPTEKQPYELRVKEYENLSNKKEQELIKKWNDEGRKGFPPTTKPAVTDIIKLAKELGLKPEEYYDAKTETFTKSYHELLVRKAISEGKIESHPDYPELSLEKTPKVEQKATSEGEIKPDNNKSTAFRLFSEGKKDRDILTATGMSNNRENIVKVRGWRKEFESETSITRKRSEDIAKQFDKELSEVTPETQKEFITKWNKISEEIVGKPKSKSDAQQTKKNSIARSIQSEIGKLENPDKPMNAGFSRTETQVKPLRPETKSKGIAEEKPYQSLEEAGLDYITKGGLIQPTPAFPRRSLLAMGINPFKISKNGINPERLFETIAPELWDAKYKDQNVAQSQMFDDLMNKYHTHEMRVKALKDMKGETKLPEIDDVLTQKKEAYNRLDEVILNEYLDGEGNFRTNDIIKDSDKIMTVAKVKESDILEYLKEERNKTEFKPEEYEDVFADYVKKEEITNERTKEIIETANEKELEKLATDIESKSRSEKEADLNEAISKADAIVSPSFEKQVKKLQDLIAEETQALLPDTKKIEQYNNEIKKVQIRQAEAESVLGITSDIVKKESKPLPKSFDIEGASLSELKSYKTQLEKLGTEKEKLLLDKISRRIESLENTGEQIGMFAPEQGGLFTEPKPEPTKTEVKVEKTEPKPLTEQSKESRIVSDEAYKKAKENLGDPKKINLKSGTDPIEATKVLKDLTTVGAYHFENGLRKFSDWAKKMIEEFGDKIRPRLRELWNGSKEEFDLIAVHNLTTENLQFADRVGGLAMPSIAVVKKNMGFEKYGDITLVAGKKMVNPETGNRVFNRDIYSPTYPTVYKYIDKKVLDKKVKEIESALPELLAKDLRFDIGRFTEDTQKGYYTISGLSHNDALRSYYLQKTNQLPELVLRGERLSHLPEFEGQYELAQKLLEKYPATKSGLPVNEKIVKREFDKMYKDPGSYSWIKDNKERRDIIQNRAEELARQDMRDRTDAVRKKFLNEYVDGYVKESLKEYKDDPEVYKIMQDHYKEVSGNIKKRFFDAYFYSDDIKKLLNPSKELNSYDYKYQKIEPLVESQKEKYLEFLEKEFGDVFGEEYLLSGKKKIPHTLDNAVDIMGTNIKGTEKTMVQGLGKSATISAKEFTSLKDISKSKDRLVAEQELEIAKKKLEDKFFDTSNKIERYYPHNEFGFDRLDNLSLAIGRISKGRITDKDIGRELSRVGYRSVPDYYYDNVREVARLMKDMPTQYFEGKKERKVYLEEFDGAVIPSDSSPKVQQLLKDKGVKRVRTYERGNETSRVNALNEFNESTFGRFVSDEALNTARENIKQKNIESLNKLGAGLGKLDPSLLKDYAVIGAYHLETVVRTGIKKGTEFRDWAKEMMTDLGEGVRPHLRAIWDEVAKNKDLAKMLKPYREELVKPVEKIVEPVKVETVKKEVVKTEKPKRFAPYVGDGETKTRGLSQTTEAKAIASDLTKGIEKLPEYNVKTNLPQIEEAAKIISTDLPKAVRIALGQEVAPNNVLPGFIYKGLEDYAVRNGDVKLLKKLGQSPYLSEQATTAGQFIQSLRNLDPLSPVEAIKDVIKTRQESSAFQRQEKIKAEYEGKIKELEDKLNLKNEALEKIEAEKQYRKVQRQTKVEQRREKRTYTREELKIEREDLYKDLAKTFTLNVGFTADQVKILAKLTKNYAQEGILSAEAVVDAIYTQIADKLDGITKKDIRDAISGYGREIKTKTKDELVTAMNDLRQQMKTISRIEELESGKTPAKKEIKKTEPSEELANLKNRLKQLESSGKESERLELAKNRVKEKIQAIESGEFEISKPKDRVIDPELDQLKQELKTVLDEHGITDYANLEKAKKMLRNKIIEYNDKIKSGDFQTKKKDPVLDEERTKLQKELDDIRDKWKYVQKTLGEVISEPEAKQIAELSRIAAESKIKMENAPRRELLKEATPEELEYGRARVKFAEYVDNLKDSASKLTFEDFKEKPFQTLGKGVAHIPGITKSLKATLDNSGLFNQHIKVLWTHPTIWQRNAIKSFQDIYHVFKGENVLAEISADIVSRPNYEKYRKDGVAVGVIEEAFPDSKLIEKVPFIGSKLHKAADTAFTGLAYRNRADLYDLYTKIAENGGNKETTGLGLGKLVNSLTGRGNLGKLERSADTFNVLFFSPRFVKSHIDVLTAHVFDKNVSPFVKKEAGKNLLKIIGGTAAVLLTAKAMGGDVELDPRSSNFGKIKVGNTRFNVSGGMNTIVTLASRLIPAIVGEGKTKNSKGELVPLNSGKYGASTGWDVLQNFLDGKLSPVAGVARDVLKGQTYGKEPVTVGKELENLVVPLPITNAKELMEDPNSANLLGAMIADAVGIFTTTYSNDSNLNKVKNSILSAGEEKFSAEKRKNFYQALNQALTDKVITQSQFDSYKESFEESQKDAPVKEETKKRKVKLTGKGL